MKPSFIILLCIVILGSAFAQVKKAGSSPKYGLQALDPSKAKTNGIPALPSIISHQGYIADSTGAGVNGPYSMTFGFFLDSTGGSAMLTQSMSAVSVTKGRVQCESRRFIDCV